MPWRFLRMEEHFELIKANFIRCEECNENFFFDFLRHPRYFVTHFKACHLKNLLYRFNGYTEEENQKTRFGPRRKRDANAWFGQLKSTEKRMISMQDNKWSEITENECWSCRLCNDGKADLTHVFELNELGRGQAFLHLRQFHEAAYEAFLQSLPDVQNTAMLTMNDPDVLIAPSSPAAGNALSTAPGTVPVSTGAAAASAAATASSSSAPITNRTMQQRLAEAERSRLRRLRATADERRTEALRSKRRRESLTPVQRQADYERRKRKKKRVEESVRSKKRREDASEDVKQKEVLRSRERRRNATEEQRQREALRSRMRRQTATEEQRQKERERCRKRYEAKKSGKHYSGTDDGGDGDSGHFSDASTDVSAYASMGSSVGVPPSGRYNASSMHGMEPSRPPPPPPPPHTHQQLMENHNFASQMPMMMPAESMMGMPAPHAMPARPSSGAGPYQLNAAALYNQLAIQNKSNSGRASMASQQAAAPFQVHAGSDADLHSLGFAVTSGMMPHGMQQRAQHQPPPYFFDADLSNNGLGSMQGTQSQGSNNRNGNASYLGNSTAV